MKISIRRDWIAKSTLLLWIRTRMLKLCREGHFRHLLVAIIEVSIAILSMKISFAIIKISFRLIRIYQKYTKIFHWMRYRVMIPCRNLLDKWPLELRRKPLQLRMLIILLRLSLHRLHRLLQRESREKIHLEIAIRGLRICPLWKMQSLISNASMYLMKYVQQEMVWYRVRFSSSNNQSMFVWLKTILYG